MCVCVCVSDGPALVALGENRIRLTFPAAAVLRGCIFLPEAAMRSCFSSTNNHQARQSKGKGETDEKQHILFCLLLVITISIVNDILLLFLMLQKLPELALPL